MHAASRLALFALGSWFAVVVARAQTESWPAIFAPKSSEVPGPPRTRAPRPGLLSEHARSLINAAAVQVLAESKAFEPATLSDVAGTDTSAGVMLMKTIVVKAVPLRESQVRPPDIQLYRFVPLGADGRRIAGGVTAPLFHGFIGQKEFQVDFSILNGAGRGIDHNLDFTRGEISFTLKW